jgi:hypothetical protein
VLPLVVYLTGLPDFADVAVAHKGATFARRFATTTPNLISDADLDMALRPFVTAGWDVPEAAETTVELCHGEPFVFQLAGERAWPAGTGETITADEVRSGWEGGRYEAATHVELILNRLPERELQLLHAMAALAPEERTLAASPRPWDAPRPPRRNRQRNRWTPSAGSSTADAPTHSGTAPSRPT